MASLYSIPDVEIDSEGKFKYILVKISGNENDSKLIVRGTKKAEFHPDIFAMVEPVMKSAGITCEVQGGGKIIHQQGEKAMKVFSKSTGYGKADHSLTVAILKKSFPDYTEIIWTEDD